MVLTPAEFHEKYGYEISNARPYTREDYDYALEHNGRLMNDQGEPSVTPQTIIDIYETRQQITSREK